MPSRIDGHTPLELATKLGDRGFFTWDGNYYALNLTEHLDVEKSGGFLRIGLVHYNTLDEVDRLLAALREIVCAWQETPPAPASVRANMGAAVRLRDGMNARRERLTSRGVRLLRSVRAATTRHRVHAVHSSTSGACATVEAALRAASSAQPEWGFIPSAFANTSARERIPG